MSIQKEYLTDKGICRVKFSLPPDPGNPSKKVCLVGDFNGWDRKRIQLRKGEDGSYSATLELKIGNEYQFRYLIDETRWENDNEADKQVPSSYQDSQNSVVVI
jgi:1,4-alpha-glucan branching enzyme